MTLGQEIFNKLSTIMATCNVSHAEFLIVLKTYRENNWYTNGELLREVVGEPQADYLKPFLPTITKEVAEESLKKLLAGKYLRRRAKGGYSLTKRGLLLGGRIDGMWRKL